LQVRPRLFGFVGEVTGFDLGFHAENGKKRGGRWLLLPQKLESIERRFQVSSNVIVDVLRKGFCI